MYEYELLLIKDRHSRWMKSEYIDGDDDARGEDVAILLKVKESMRAKLEAERAHVVMLQKKLEILCDLTEELARLQESVHLRFKALLEEN